MDAAAVKQLIASLTHGCGVATSPLTRESVFESAGFEDFTDAGKTELAKFFVLESCSRIGAFASNGDVVVFLRRFSAELTSWPKSGDHASRRLEHIAFAVSGSLAFASPLGALSATYLVHQLEYLFRAMSGALTLDGAFVDARAKAAIEHGLGRRLSNRVNRIEDAYEIMRLSTGLMAPRVFAELDAQLPPIVVEGGQVLSNIGERMAYLRHPVSHGPMADASSEGPFYSLSMAIAIYGSSLFPRT